ncbi:hypothetical protein PZ938_17735 [Luteipulveratus sp. YIM 133132]|uniref:Uncharacterized protein n=1 Tax=Luteipulveratus flavus TaxID=3031728 RepID=A0ABT6C3U1_9MICO|nr:MULTISPECIES: hypothetical protein [unclassified Luteipulveratus]MDE9367466.1 hypothetical protein [Luteipulveratus sp. YIM 133132]MDF8263468.1 hypothetical protein [Luteipulveratus sp. YIM 133296]
MARSSAVVTATTQHLLRRRQRFVLGDQPTGRPVAAPKPAGAPVR